MSSIRIFIVDDHELVRRGLRSLLSARTEWQVCGEAVDGEEAVAQAKQLRPDVVLMDVSMPRMNGLDATRIIRRELPDSKVVIVSQNDPTVVRRQVYEVDAAAYVAKSELSNELLPTLDKLLSSQDNTPGKRNGTGSRSKSDIASQPCWLTGGGSLGKLIRDRDWSKTSLGPIELWPQSLRTSVSLMLNSRHPMWIGWGPENLFLYNDAYIQVLSLAKHPSCLGQPAKDVWSEIWDICGPLADKVFDNAEATFVDDVRLFMNRGDRLEETYYSFSYSPIHDEAGKVGGLFCPSTETTAKILNARRLSTLSELAANAVVENTTAAACASSFATLSRNRDDIPFALLYLVNPAGTHACLQETIGITGDVERVSNKTVNLDGDSDPSDFWQIQKVFNTGDAQVISLKELQSVPSGAAEQPVTEAIIVPVISSGQEQPLGILVAGVNPTRSLDSDYRTFYDLIAGQVATVIQNARSTEEERARAESLAKLDRAKTAFFSNVSHEFRTPLTLMLGPVEDLLSRSHTDLSPAAKGQLELVNRNGARLLRLVNTLLDFSRIEAGRMQAIYQPTDISRFTTELASVFGSATERAGLKLRLDCPAIAEPVYLDRGMWEKVVLNLISNAFKFTFDGSISISVQQVGHFVELRVNDTGVGIPAEELPKLFERFHRVENSRSRTHEGSGIGLALVQELVRLHEGSVDVRSTLGVGTTFTVRIPLGTAHLPADRIGGTRTLASTALGAAPFVEEAMRWLPEIGEEPDSDEIPSGHEFIPIPYRENELAPTTLHRPRILVADDNSDMRQYIRRLMEERYEIIAVPDGQAALEAIHERAPDLVLTDVMMPQVDGFGLLRAIRANEKTRTIPVILLSARAGEESRIEGMERGADDYLIKPFSARELLARVQGHLQLALVRKEAEEALREEKGRLKLATEAAQLGIWHWYPDEDRAVWENNRVYEVFGLGPEDKPLTSADFTSKVLHPDDLPTFTKAFGNALATGARLQLQCRLKRKDGTIGWLELTGQLEKKIEGSPRRMLGTVLDITERKQIEERERRTKAEAIAATAKFRAVFDQTSVFAGILSLEGIVIDANQLCLDFCGYTTNEIIGRPFWETGWWKGSSELKSIIRSAIKQASLGTPFREILPYSWSDGTQRVVEFAIHPIRDEHGDILFLHPTGIDITDLKRAEENYRTLAETLELEVRERTKELEHRNIEILKQSEQLRGVSHRLMQIQDDERRHIARELHDSAGQILAALGMNLASVVQRSRQSDPRLFKDAEEAQLLARQLNQEIRTTSYLLHPPLLDESGLGEALLWYLRGLKERSNLEITLDIPDSFGRLSHEMELVLFRIVQECLTNVHRHSGSKTAFIRLSRTPQAVSLEVRDEGKGILPERLAEIQSLGAGVGIRGMRERILQLGGEMNIRSESTGTTVSVLLPLDGQ